LAAQDKATVTPALFNTEQLRCRRWIAQDFEALYAVYSDTEAMRWVGNGKPITRSECEEWFKVTEANYATRGYGMFAVDSLTSCTVVGFGGLVHPGGQSEAEVKYAFLRSHWGNGFASEFVPALLAYGERRHGLKRVIATVAPANFASQRVLLKSGMRLLEQRKNADGTSTCVYQWLAPSAA
jgi:RimJ/RimL family protein N-acetyltransferase